MADMISERFRLEVAIAPSDRGIWVCARLYEAIAGRGARDKWKLRGTCAACASAASDQSGNSANWPHTSSDRLGRSHMLRTRLEEGGPSGLSTVAGRLKAVWRICLDFQIDSGRIDLSALLRPIVSVFTSNPRVQAEVSREADGATKSIEQIKRSSCPAFNSLPYHKHWEVLNNPYNGHNQYFYP